MPEKNTEWSQEKLEANEASKKNMKKNLNPLHKEEAYLLLTVLLLIASGPVGIGLGVGLIGSYGAIKAFQVRQLINKAKKIKAQKLFQEQNSLKTNALGEEDEMNEVLKTKEDQSPKEIIDKDLQEKIEKERTLDKNDLYETIEKEQTLADFYKNEEDLSLALSHLDNELLDRISSMSDEQIESSGRDISSKENPENIVEKLLTLKKSMREKVTTSNTLKPETQEQAKSLHATLSKLFNQSIDSKIEPDSITPSQVELKREVKHSPDSETKQTEAQGAANDILRHNTTLASVGATQKETNQVRKTLEKTKASQSIDFSLFAAPTNTLTGQGEKARSKQVRQTSEKGKSQTAQTAKAFRKAK